MPKKGKKTRVVALIVAGGSGQRLGGAVPKQYRSVAGIPVLRRSILAFLQHPTVDAVCVVIRPEDRKHYEKAVEGLKILPPVMGGATRQQSVSNGLKSLSKISATQVLIHDAARPLVSAEVITRVLKALTKNKGAVPAVAVADTIKKTRSGKVESTLKREALVAVQTPQGFHFADILKAHRAATHSQYPDDAALLEASGEGVAVVEGSTENFKITTEADMKRAEALLGGKTETRVAQGFDVHAFEPEGSAKHILLCGVKVPYGRKLEGHSDADVGLHALTDAILGAIAREDIGYHFSPKDKRWKNADSVVFLEHAAKLLAEEGGRLVHADITFMGEEPKISPHREAMRKKLSLLLGVDLNRISIKATTTEKLGFLGRKEGLAAQAVVTIELSCK